VDHLVEERLKYGGEMTTGVRTYLNLHLNFVKTAIDIRILNDFELNLVRLRHGQGIKRRHLAGHVVQDL